MLEREPDKIQLHFCSGLINFYAKRDYAGAVRDFDLFLGQCPPPRFQRQQVRAQQLLNDARKAL
jgi:hypothetical protein